MVPNVSVSINCTQWCPRILNCCMKASDQDESHVSETINKSNEVAKKTINSKEKVKDNSCQIV